MNEDLRGLSGLMRDKGFTKPQKFAPGGAVMQANPMMQTPAPTQATQEMQKNDLMGQLLNLVGDDNPEVIKLLRDAPVSELMKAVQEITEANATVTSTSS